VLRPKADTKNIDWGAASERTPTRKLWLSWGTDVVGETNEGMIAEWVLRRSPMVSFGFGFGGVGYGHHASTGVGVGTSVSPPPSGEYLHLRFDRDGKLTEWTRVRY